MSKFGKIRQWANRDNGKHYQIGNRSLNAREGLGYLLMIGAMLIYITNDKTNFNEGWIGWVLLVLGFVFATWGIKSGVVEEHEKRT